MADNKLADPFRVRPKDNSAIITNRDVQTPGRMFTSTGSKILEFFEGRAKTGEAEEAEPRRRSVAGEAAPPKQGERKWTVAETDDGFEARLEGSDGQPVRMEFDPEKKKLVEVGTASSASGAPLEFDYEPPDRPAREEARQQSVATDLSKLQPPEGQDSQVTELTQAISAANRAGNFSEVTRLKGELRLRMAVLDTERRLDAVRERQ
jgi:hypothetical protein